MKERVQFQDMNLLWGEHIRQSESARMTDDEVEREFWRGFMRRKEDYAPEASSRQVVEKLLLPLLRKHQIETALEWGPGWGHYTIDLAKFCREVDCVDISRDVLDFILRIGAEQGCKNLNAVQAKWEDFEPERSYDLVFGYNCFYRQENLAECFARMDRVADRLCVAGMNNGLAPTWVCEMEKAGAQVRWEWKDYIYFVGVLYQMGIDPNLTILPFTKTIRYPNEEAMVKGECTRCAPGSIRHSDALDILKRFFDQQPDGSWQAAAEFHSGIVWWVPLHLSAHPKCGVL